jgi:uncharacterized OB-fold protein
MADETKCDWCGSATPSGAARCPNCAEEAFGAIGLQARGPVPVFRTRRVSPEAANDAPPPADPPE